MIIKNHLIFALMWSSASGDWFVHLYRKRPKLPPTVFADDGERAK